VAKIVITMATFTITYSAKTKCQVRGSLSAAFGSEPGEEIYRKYRDSAKNQLSVMKSTCACYKALLEQFNLNLSRYSQHSDLLDTRPFIRSHCLFKIYITIYNLLVTLPFQQIAGKQKPMFDLGQISEFKNFKGIREDRHLLSLLKSHTPVQQIQILQVQLNWNLRSCNKILVVKKTRVAAVFRKI